MAEDGIQKNYQIEFAATGVMLVLTPAAFETRAETEAAVEAEINKKQIESVDYAAIKKAFEDRAASPVKFAPTQPEPVDGKVLARMDELGAMVLIKVEPPMGKGKKAGVQDVMDSIKLAGGEKFYVDLEKVEGLLSSFKHRDFVPVAEKKDGKFEVTVTKDGTEATLTLFQAFGGRHITIADIAAQLKELKIKFGIKKETIDSALKKEIYNETLVIAVGERPVDGEDGYVEFFFDTKGDRPKPKITEDGDVDFKELNTFQNCKNGEPLAKKHPAQMGRAGRDVYGNEMPARNGKDVPLPVGVNTKPDQANPNLVRASADGQPKLMGAKINVIPIIEIPHDVDFSTGNINFTGSVKIRGNVMSGFSVKSMGDIEVGGCIEMATIECGGNLTVKQGILGQDKAMIICRGSVTAKFIDKTTVYADGDVIVDESIIYSKISSSGKIELLGKKGYIMGGVTRASKAVTCKQAGTQTQSPTIIEVGGSPTLRDEFEKLEQEIKDAEEKTKMQSKSLESVERRRELAGDELTEEQKQRVLLLTRERFALLARLRAFKEKKENIEEKLASMRSQGLKVHVKEKALPGTKICIKNAVLILHDQIDFVTFRESDGNIETGPYEGI